MDTLETAKIKQPLPKTLSRCTEIDSQTAWENPFAATAPLPTSRRRGFSEAPEDMVHTWTHSSISEARLAYHMPTRPGHA